MSGANGAMEPKGGTPNIATRSVAKGNALYPAMSAMRTANEPYGSFCKEIIN